MLPLGKHITELKSIILILVMKVFFLNSEALHERKGYRGSTD